MLYESDEIKQAAEVWFTNVKKEYEPYFAPDFPENDKNAAIRFMYLCGLDPKTETTPICKIITDTRKELGEENYIPSVSKMLAEHYEILKYDITVKDIGLLFAENAYKNWASRNIAETMAIVYQKKLNGKKYHLSEEDRDMVEEMICELRTIRGQITEANKKVRRLQKKWDEEHHLRINTIYLNKKLTNEIYDFRDAIDPTCDARYGMCLAERTYKNGAMLKLTLGTVLNKNGKNIPAIHVAIIKDDEVMPSDFELTDKLNNYPRLCDWVHLNNYSYAVIINFYNKASNEHRVKTCAANNPKIAEYPINIAMNVCQVGSPELVTKEMMELVVEALNSLNAKCQQLILMRYRDGMKFKEIGETCGLSLDKVHRIIHDGILFMQRTPELNQIINGETESNHSKKQKYLNEYGLSTRVARGLMRAGILTMEDLKKTDLKRISNIRNIGPTAMNELKEFLIKEGVIYDTNE